MDIKSIIEYYYGLYNVVLHKKKEKYTFEYQDDLYVFSPLKRNENDITIIFNLIHGNKKYDQIIVNKYNNIITEVNGIKYLLIKKTSNTLDLISIIFEEEQFIQPFESIVNNKSNWGELWSRKIDNIEYQLQHIENKYPLIEKSIDYYIGMTESAISYINNIDDQPDNKVISHIRIYDNDFNNPQNILIDYKSRDISEYLKYIFISNKYDYDYIKKLLTSIRLSDFSWKLLYSRMFFPNFYFDLYDEIVVDKKDEKALYSILERIEEYEIYLDSIYEIICEQKKIPKIIWY